MLEIQCQFNRLLISKVSVKGSLYLIGDVAYDLLF
jgi:hypothetical protein